MDTPSRRVTRLISQACARHPGGLRAVFQAINVEQGGRKAESTFYADFNPNETSAGKLKVADLIDAMRITGDVEALRYLAGLFGYVLAALDAIEPDAPTLEAEMLSDYPSVVAFHKEVAEYGRGDGDPTTMLAALDLAVTDLRQTAAKAIKEKR